MTRQEVVDILAGMSVCEVPASTGDLACSERLAPPDDQVAHVLDRLATPAV